MHDLAFLMTMKREKRLASSKELQKTMGFEVIASIYIIILRWFLLNFALLSHQFERDDTPRPFMLWPFPRP